jgi:hypothetical protein
MSATLDKIKEEVKTLAPDELHQVRELVDSLLTEPAKPQMTEDEFERYLAAKGVISLPEPSTETSEDDDWEPVEFTGQPLSEMIVEDRR